MLTRSVIIRPVIIGYISGSNDNYHIIDIEIFESEYKDSNSGKVGPTGFIPPYMLKTFVYDVWYFF